MTGPQQMASVRRRIPGMTSQPSTADSGVSGEPSLAPAAAAPESVAAEKTAAGAGQARRVWSTGASRSRASARNEAAAPSVGRAQDYAATRLVNFRIPVELHDRFKQLIHDVELQHPRLRHPSLTELVIALLEEGPDSADEAAE